MTPVKYVLLCLAIAATIIALWCLPGCQSAAFSEGDYVGQGLRATADIPATPGAVVSTHEDGTVTVTALPATPVPAATATPVVAAPAPTAVLAQTKPSPVVAITVIQPTPGKSFSYTITPETQKGDKLAASRMCTWAGEAPGTVVEKVATQKQTRTHNPLPAISVDETGIHATTGGGSIADQAGQSWFQRAWVWLSDTVKGWLWWLVIAGIAVAAFFILPILVPALAPLFASIAGAFHGAWTYITGEIGKLFAWLKTIHLTKSVSVAPAVSPSTPTAPAPSPVPATVVGAQPPPSSSSVPASSAAAGTVVAPTSTVKDVVSTLQ